MDTTLPIALRLVFGHEGGYSNVKTDAGGPTKYGITHKVLAAWRKVDSVTSEEVKALTIEEATEIYRRTYWTQSGGNLLPAGLDYAAFDFGVNSGPSRAVKTLQKVLGVTQDGSVGSMTLKAVQEYNGGIRQLIEDYCEARMHFLRQIAGPQGFSANGRGWTRRVTGVDPDGKIATEPGVIGNALKMASNVSVIVPEKPKPTGFEPGSPKATAENLSVTNIATKPEMWGPLAAALSAMGSLLTGTGPLQYALAVGVVAGVGVGVYYFIRRMRENG